MATSRIELMLRVQQGLSPASRAVFDGLMRAPSNEARQALGLPGSGGEMSEAVRTMLREIKAGVAA